MLPIVRGARLQIALNIFVAVVLATLSLLHQHTLIPDDPSPAPCVVCAIGAEITVAPPQPIAPAAVEYLLAAANAEPLCTRPSAAPSTRGPPAAA
jgi:hypothetical protein